MREEFSIFYQDTDDDFTEIYPFIDSLDRIFSDYQQHLEYCIFIFCSDEYLLRINQEYLNHHYYTDIITFDYSNEQVEGEMYISTERVTYNAGDLGVDPTLELKRVLIHGCLHLCGLGDKSSTEKEEMRAKEEYYLNLLSE